MKKKTVFVITNTDFYTNNVTQNFSKLQQLNGFTNIRICTYAMKKKTVIVITDTDKCSKNMSCNYSKVKE